MNNEIAVVGGGAAGMMAAIAAAERGARVTLLEPNERLGKKLNITGKGRCNVTNNCSMEELLANIPRNGRFLWSAFSRFNAQDAMVFFEELGVPLKTERGNRVFPQSDRSFDVSGALDKLDEETRELREAAERGTNFSEELGDVLFAAVKAGRFLNVDPEDALNATCEKFIARFRRVEEACAARGAEMSSLPLDELTRLWNEAKHPTE